MKRLNIYYNGNLLQYAAKRKMFFGKSTLLCSETTLLRNDRTPKKPSQKCSQKDFTAPTKAEKVKGIKTASMTNLTTVFYFHLQPQFKYDLFHILHITSLLTGDMNSIN